MTPLSAVTSTVVVLPIDDVDTDQIIPARFLKGTEKTGLGAHLFADRRTTPDFPLERAGAAGSRILLAGANFGCGSSREHAPWALVDWGFRVIIAPSFGDIFRENATKNGLLTVALPVDACGVIGEALGEVTVDLRAEEVRTAAATFSFAIDPFARHCLLDGIDELSYILAFDDRISAYEDKAR